MHAPLTIIDYDGPKKHEESEAHDLLLQMSRKKKLLLDFNGKLGLNPLEDFLFDLQKKKIASQQGYIYYRLWISNLFNSNSLELKKIKSILN